MRCTMGVVLAAACLVGRPASGLDLYVSVNGNDGWSGRRASVAKSQDGPFATLERARDEIRRLKANGRLGSTAVTVHLREGIYALGRPFKLTAEDSGAAEAPITYRAYRQERPRVVGGREVTGFAPVTDPVVLDQLVPEARPHVLQADLKPLHIDDLGTIEPEGNRFELFYDDRPMTLARWPNEQYARIGELVGDKAHEVISHGNKGNGIGKFKYERDRPARWKREKDPWVSGYWFYDWANSFARIESIDTRQRIISLKPPYHRLGYRTGQRYFALNLLSEIDTPGEWYLDRDTRTLYFWPPSDESGQTGGASNGNGEPRAFVSVIGHLLELNGVSHVTVRGLVLEYNRDTAIMIRDGAHVRVAGCTLRNMGGRAVRIEGGSNHAVIGCDVYDTGEGGIWLDGGDRTRLVPGHHRVLNNHLYRYSRNRRTRRAAVDVNGVGHSVSHNLIHDAPHTAIQFRGNEHLIEFNDIHRVCMETDDAGAVYSGRNWTWRGNRIEHNYFHHMGDFMTVLGVQSVYLDDLMGGTTVRGNVFYKGGRGVLIGGGRNNIVDNNIFVDCTPAVHVDSRGTGWAKEALEDRNNPLYTTLAKIPYKEPPWSTRYPELLTLLDDQPAIAKYNVVTHNVCVGGKWIELHDQLTDQIVRIENNLTDRDPLFVDAAAHDFRIRSDSPAFELGFKPIPFEKIGLYQDELRASWPPPPRPE